MATFDSLSEHGVRREKFLDIFMNVSIKLINQINFSKF